MSKSFLDKLNKKIEKLSNINITNINGRKRRSLRTISNLPLFLLNTTIPMDIEVNDTQGYMLIAGVDQINKVQEIINLREGYFEFIQNNTTHTIPITCWEKANYQNGEPLNINNNIEENNPPINNNINDDDDEYESDNEFENSQGFIVIGNNNKLLYLKSIMNKYHIKIQ